MARAPEFRIGEHLLAPSSPVYFIAEIGINHNGDLDTALELIKVAFQGILFTLRKSNLTKLVAMLLWEPFLLTKMDMLNLIMKLIILLNCLVIMTFRLRETPICYIIGLLVMFIY